ncbi:MAG: hypothetical protein LBK52_07300, partial [Deltaproteobacteria bacterium]|nr:hypothetical protein [Deltaproteobacteria bacterium]
MKHLRFGFYGFLFGFIGLGLAWAGQTFFLAAAGAAETIIYPTPNSTAADPLGSGNNSLSPTLASPSGNSVTAGPGADIPGAVYGGVNLTGGSVTDNSVTISGIQIGSSYGGSVYGGYANLSQAADNNVTISSGNFSG